MKNLPIGLYLVVCLFLAPASWIGTATAQQSAATPAASATSEVPNLINYSGVLKDANGHTLTGITGVTFLLYKDEQGGAPLWLETQNVTPDRLGHYAVQLGAASTNGIPADLFLSGEPRWLAVQVAGETEQARVVLVAVPYAMKAADAATIGGLPPSAFVLAAPPAGIASNLATSAAVSSSSDSSRTTSDVTTTGGTANTLPLFSTATNIQNSAITQTGSGTTAKIGINSTTPNATLYVNGATTSNGVLTLPASGTASATAGKDSQPEDFIASVFNSSTATAVPEKFQWQAEPAGNDTTTASGTLNLLFASGTATPAETGMKISSKGVLTFAAGQTFPGTGTGDGSVTSVATGLGLEGGPITKTGTLSINTAVVPQLSVANTFKANQTIDGNLTATGIITAPTMTASGTVTAGTLDATNETVSNTFSISNGVEFPMTVISSNSSATSILGEATGTGEAWGVEGFTESSDPEAYGVVGFAEATSGDPIGVYGSASSVLGIGVFGQNGSESGTGSAFAGAYPVGTWGDGGTGSSSPGIAVMGTVDNGWAGVFYNDSERYTLEAEAGGTGPIFFAENSNVGGYCDIDASGDLSCSGSKNAVVPVDGGSRTVALSAIESPKNWFEDFGEAEMVNGAAVVQIDSTYTQTVNTEAKYEVFLTPYGDCKGLYVSNRTANSFEVHELGGGMASLSFGYRITALRKNYENVRFADHTHDMDGTKLMQKRMRAAQGAKRSHNPTKNIRPPVAPVKTAELKPAAATTVR